MTEFYLDHAATTPLSESAREAMTRALADFGNPSSIHNRGRRAKEALDMAREVIADSLGALFGEICFTSSGTEAANAAILGLAYEHAHGPRRRILMSAAEHHCILNTRPALERLGFQIELIPVLRDASVSLGALEARMGDDVLLIAAMHGNNEFGTLNPINGIAQLAKTHGAFFVCDLVQTYLTRHAELTLEGIDIATVSAHKIYGPSGIGAMRIRSGVLIQPLIAGGGQERDLRGGTENMVGIAGFAAAVTNFGPAATHRQHRNTARTAFLKGLRSTGAKPIFSTELDPESTLEGHLHLRFPGKRADSLLIKLDQLGIRASSGAACSSGSIEPSHVMLAAGYSAEEAQTGLRFTFGNGISVAEAEEAGQIVGQAAL